MGKITLESAEKIIDSAIAEGKALGLQPMCVAVSDASGSLVAFKKTDGVIGNLRFDIAYGKAKACLALGMTSRRMADIAVNRPHFGNALMALSGGEIVPVAGGLLIKTTDGEVLGAVGASGDKGDGDEAVVKAGLEAAGFVVE